MNFQKKGAKWLWDGEAETHNQYLCFRQKINLESAEKAYISLCCDTNYELYVNGKFVNFGQYLGMPENKFYDKLDVTEYVSVGENYICIAVYYQGLGTSCYATGTPGLIYFVECDGKIYPNVNAVTAHATGYREGQLPLISSQLGPSFEYDARSAKKWTETDFDDNGWNSAVIRDFSAELCADISERPVKKLEFSKRADYTVVSKGTFSYTAEQEMMNTAERMQKAAMTMTSPFNKIRNSEIVIENDNASIILDLGGETSGCFELRMLTESEVRVDVSYGEHLADLRVRSHIGNRNFAFTYYSTVGENNFTNYFRRIAGRYIQLNLTGVSGKCVIKYAGLRKTEYPVKMKKGIDIPDLLHRKIYETSIKTLKECMHEHYEDCPWREQSLYAFDSKNQILAGYAVFENHKFAKACLELLDSTLEDDGYQKICVPKSDNLKIPGFSIMWIAAVCEYAEHTGRINDVKKLLGHAEKMFDLYFEKTDGNGAVLLPAEKNFWFFYDWADGLSGTIKLNGETPKEQKTDAVFCLEICYALNKYIRVCKNNGIDGKNIEKYYNSLKKSVNKVFYDKERKLYKTFEEKEHYCQLVQSLAICSGVAQNPKQLRHSIIYDKTLIPTTLSTMALKYEALMDDSAYRNVILDEIAEIWGEMLFEGATTFYETADGESAFANAGSLCHGWSAIPLIVYEKFYGPSDKQL